MTSGTSAGDDAVYRQELTTDRQNLNRRRLSVLYFSIGVLVGMFLLGASVYADFESTLFDVSLSADARIRPLQCPVLLAAHETGEVSLRLRNPGAEPITRRVNTNISRGHLIMMSQYTDVVTLEPGESRRLSWNITARDAAYGHLIMVKITTLVNPRNPLQRGSCGVLVLNLPGQIRGSYLVGLLLAVALTGTIGGMRGWWHYGRSYTGWQLEATRAIMLLGSVVLVGLAMSMVGFWEIAAGAFYIAVLAVGVIVPHFLINSRQNW